MGSWQTVNFVITGSAISPAMTVLIEDQYGNLTTSTALVSLTLAVSGDSISSGGTANAAAGTATFGAVVLSGSTSGHSGTFTANSGSLTSATSSSFSVF